MAALEAQAQTFGIVDRVMLTGVVEDVRPWIGSFDVLLMPSRSEGMPLTLGDDGACVSDRGHGGGGAGRRPARRPCWSRGAVWQSFAEAVALGDVVLRSGLVEEGRSHTGKGLCLGRDGEMTGEICEHLLPQKYRPFLRPGRRMMGVLHEACADRRAQHGGQPGRQ